MKFNRLVVLFLSLGLTLPVVAEDATVSSPVPQSLAQITAPSSAGTVTGMIDVRPTLGDNLNKPLNSDVRLENTIDLGYQFNPNMYLGYRQYFESGNDTASMDKQKIVDSIVRIKAKNIWTSGNTSFDYEGRLYLPFSQALQDATHNMSVRHYLKLNQKVTDTLTVTLMEVPILHSYTQAGTDQAGTQKANPGFENRVILNTHLDITEKLGFDFPIFYYTTFNRTYSPALNSGRVANQLLIYPELDYAINKTYTVGIAYYSDNIMSYDANGNYTGLNLGAGLDKGAIQAVLQVNL